MQGRGRPRSDVCRGFTTLSATLGQLVVTTHHGLFEAIEQEAYLPAVASSLRALAVLATAAPYARLPADLLPRVIQAGPSGLRCRTLGAHLSVFRVLKYCVVCAGSGGWVHL